MEIEFDLQEKELEKSKMIVSSSLHSVGLVVNFERMEWRLHGKWLDRECVCICSASLDGGSKMLAYGLWRCGCR